MTDLKLGTWILSASFNTYHQPNRVTAATCPLPALFSLYSACALHNFLPVLILAQHMHCKRMAGLIITQTHTHAHTQGCGLTKHFPLHAHSSQRERKEERDSKRESMFLWEQREDLKPWLLMKAFALLSELKHVAILSHSPTFKWLCQQYGAFITVVC